MIEYWHWHTNHFGTETYWVGILPHDQQPGRVYAELSRLGADFQCSRFRGRRTTAGRRRRSAVLVPIQVGSGLSGRPSRSPARPPSDLRPTSISGPTIGSSTRSTAALSMPGCRRVSSTTSRSSGPTASAARASRAGRRAAGLVVPGLLVADDALLAGCGTTLRPAAILLSVRAPRTATRKAGLGSRSNRPTWQRAEACATRSSPTSPNRCRWLPKRTRFNLSEGAAATSWVDQLISDGAKVIVGYEHPHFGRFPSVVSSEYGHRPDHHGRNRA